MEAQVNTTDQANKGQALFCPSRLCSLFTSEERAMLNTYVPIGASNKEAQEVILRAGGKMVVIDLRPVVESEWGKPEANLVDGLKRWYDEGRESWTNAYLPDVKESELNYILIFTVVPLERLHEEDRARPECMTVLQFLEGREDRDAKWFAPAGTTRGKLPCG